MVIKIEDILDNAPEEFEVPGIGFVKLRLPTTKEKLDARIEVSKTIGYSEMNEVEKKTEFARILALKMIQDPVISIEQYLGSNDVKMSILLDTVSIWYSRKLKELNDKRSKLVKDFLDQMMAP